MCLESAGSVVAVLKPVEPLLDRVVNDCGGDAFADLIWVASDRGDGLRHLAGWILHQGLAAG